MNPIRRRHLRILLPFGVLALALVCSLLAWATRPRVAPSERKPQPEIVRVLTLQPRDLRLRVEAHGSVSPRTESDLVPEVSGRVISVGPNFVSGGAFAAGEVLFEIDPADAQANLLRAQAAAARAGSEYERAHGEMERVQKLHDKGAVSQSRYDESRAAESVASALAREARAALEQAERDRERTSVRAPFAGRVRQKQVDIGQFVARGTPVARLYASDLVEVRLPVSDSQFAYLELPLQGVVPDATAAPAVAIEARFGAETRRWQGRVHRTEGEIDPRTRAITVVARIDEDAGSTPPAVGLFVRAEIEGRRVPGAIVIPRHALDENHNAWVVDAEGRLERREVGILRAQRDEVVVAHGLAEGDRLVISPLRLPVAGARVEVEGEEPAKS